MGGVQTVGCVPRKAADIEWIWIKREGMCAYRSRAREWNYQSPLECIQFHHEPQIGNMELQVLVFALQSFYLGIV